MADEFYPTQRVKVLGVASGWDQITTAQPEDSTRIPSNDHEYTLPDLYLMVKRLLNSLDPDRLEYITRLISEHIHDYNNPHRTSLEKMDTSVLKELYNLWLEHGYTGSEDVFLKQLFQYVKIADLETTREGTSLDQVPSVYSAATIVEDHNTSTDVHAELLTAMFPGTPLPGQPTYAILGLVSNAGVPDALEVKRTGKMWVSNSFGDLIEVDENKIKPDYTLGDPALPVFKGYSNSVTYSEDLSNSFYTKTNVTVEKSTSIYSPRVLDEFVYYVKESQDETPKEHKLTFKVSNLTKDRLYTVSAYVYPVNRNAFIIKVPSNLAGEYSTVGYDFTDQKYFINDAADHTVLTCGITHIPSGWYRVWLTFKAKESVEADATADIELILADIFDGDTTYNGNGLSGACVFGVQFSESDTLVPYLPTNGSTATVGATSLKLPVDEEWFNKDASTIILEISNVSPLVQMNTSTIYALANDNTSQALEVKFPTSHNNRPYFTSYSDSNTVLTQKWGNTNDSLRSVVGQSYNTTEMTYLSTGGDPISEAISSPVNSSPKYFYLGCNRYSNDPLNGYIFGFIYYPFKCSIDNLKFFLEDPLYANRDV